MRLIGQSSIGLTFSVRSIVACFIFRAWIGPKTIVPET